MDILQKKIDLDDYYKKINLLILIILPVSLLMGSGVINFLVILFDILFIIEIFKKRKFIYFKDKIFYLLIIIWVYLILNATLGIDFENSIDRSLGFIRFVILAFGINYYLYTNQKYFTDFILKYWCLIFFIVTIDLIFESFMGFNLIGNISPDKGRLSSFLGEELKIGNYYFGFILLTLAYLNFKYKENYILYFFSVVFIITGLLIGERSNFLKILFITSLFLFFFQNKNYIKKIFVILISFVFLASIIYSNNNYKDRFWIMLIKPVIQSSLNPVTTLKMSTYGAHYDAAIKIFNDNKFFGIGLKNFRMESGNTKYRNKEFIFTDARQTTHPHQMHVEILSEIGLMGYSLFLLLFYLIIHNGIKFYKNSKNLFQLSSLLFVIATIIPLLPSGSFFTTYSATIFWINFGLLIQKRID